MTKLKENNEKPLFELRESSEDKLVYQRVIKDQGKSKKKTKHIIAQLPTATVHVMSEEDFKRLKQIEEELNSQISLVREKISLKDAIYRFLEL